MTAKRRFVLSLILNGKRDSCAASVEIPIIAMASLHHRAVVRGVKQKNLQPRILSSITVKFPINKAFYIAYTVCVEGKPLSSYCYADQLSLNQMTCWKFRKRIENCP